MNNLNKTLLLLTIVSLSSIATYGWLEQSYVKLEKTKSGMFIINNGHIYTVSELVTDDSTAYKMRELK